MPTILVKIEDDETDMGLGAGIVAVEATTSLPFSLTLQVPIRIGRQEGKRDIDVRARRQQIPLTIANASTLYTLQGATCDPGLIYHWKAPRRLSPLMKWIAAYMALSRVRSLKNFRSVGLTDAVKDLINGGPPAGMLTRFLSLFDEKRAETEKIVQSAMLESDW